MSMNDTMALIGLVTAIAIMAGILADVYKRRLAFRERQLELTARHTAEKAAQYAAQAERLEQRVRVLERIATDRNAGLAGEIEALRDAQVN